VSNLGIGLKARAAKETKNNKKKYFFLNIENYFSIFFGNYLIKI
jgi:hypothetical protein